MRAIRMRQVDAAVDSCRMGEAVPWHGGTQERGTCRLGVSEPVRRARANGSGPCRVPAAGQGAAPGAEAEPQALEAMGLFDLEYAADRRFGELSGGEAQRLMLARAVCSRPDMLLVDEPTAQLDTRTAHSVSHVLGNLAGQGMIVLVATHDPDTRDACGRVIDLADYAPGDNEDSSFAPAGGNEPAEPTDPAPAGGGSREAVGVVRKRQARDWSLSSSPPSWASGWMTGRSDTATRWEDTCCAA